MHRTLPLADSFQFRTRDPDESRHLIGQAFGPHVIEVHGNPAELATELHEAPFSGSSLCYITYGTTVSIDTASLDGYYLVQVPWRGKIEVDTGQHIGTFQPGTASVVSPTNPLHMRWSKDSSHFTVKLSRSALETRLSRQLGSELRAPLILGPVLEFDCPEGRRWCDTVNFVRQQLENPIPEQIRAPLELQLEDTLCLMLLEIVNHNYSERLHNISTTVAPKTVRRACHYIADNIQANITLDDLASATAVSPATLSKHFRHYLGQSPLQYVRAKKLDAVHLVLKQSHSSMSVTEIALRYGFNHLGRFSQYYRGQFGQCPSVTLKNH